MLDKQIFAERRRKFMSRMNGGVAVFPSNPVRMRNNDVEYEYRQDSDFYYLTGFEEPDSVCVLAPGHPKHEYVLFVRPRDREKEIWNGYRAGVEGAIQNFGAEMAYETGRIKEFLPEMLQDVPSLYFALNKFPEADQVMFSILDLLRKRHKAGVYPPSQIIDPRDILAEMRLIKNDADLAVLQRAVDISAEAHTAAMHRTAPGKYEYEIQAVLEYVFRSNGAMRNGYQCIVGSGPNSCILHYRENTRRMQRHELLLVDAGAEFGYFTADITRTWPVNGKFSPEQKAVYEVVLDAQKRAIDRVRPGVEAMAVHDYTVRLLTEGMVSLGLLEGSVDELIENNTYSKYYMHRTFHWLGMDVHDAGRYRVGGKWRELEPGIVTTIEPGIYIPLDDEHERFRGIGIRIEDDVLVTPEAPRVLTAACPKEIADLESIVGSLAGHKAFA